MNALPLSPGDILGRFELLAPLREGAGEAFHARDRSQGRLVALHILPPGSLTEPIRASSSLHHPHILAVHEAGSDRGVDYIATELLDGRPLGDMVPPEGLPLLDVLRYGGQVAAALSAAHTAGILHGNLTPGNIIVDPAGKIKVRNFATPKPAKDERSDIFDLGTLLYRMATGRDPRVPEPIPPRELRQDLPPEIGRVIQRCLRAEPARRFQHMADLRVALEELAEDAATGNLMAPEPHHSRVRPWHWIALGATAVAAIVGLWRLSSSVVHEEPGQQAFPLTGYAGEEYSPSFSPDGNHVAFTWNGERVENFDIYVKPVGPGMPVRLTTSPSLDRGPRWSPDGRMIAFLRDLEGARTAVIVIPASGGPERRIADVYRNHGNFSGALDWTPDSKWLFVAGAREPDQPRALMRVSVETGVARQATNPPPGGEGDVTPAVSPDGRMLAFLRAAGPNPEILLQPLGPRFEPSGKSSVLPTGGHAPSSVAWMPDGTELIFSSGEGILSQLYRAPVSGIGAVRPVGLAGMGAIGPTLSAAGHRLAYMLQVQDTNIWRTALNDRSVPEKLVATSFREVFPQFSPDGNRLAFHSNQNGEIQIWTSDVQGSHPVQLTHLHGAIARNARWSPDGKQLVFESNRTGAWQIFTISASGEHLRQLTRDAFDNETASWSQNGAWIYYSSRRGGAPQVWKIPSEGGTAAQVTGRGGEAPLESPDARTLYYVKGEGRRGLWSMSLSGGEETLVFASIYRFNYALSRKGVYFTAAPNAGGESSIQVLDLASGEIFELAKIEKPLDLGLALSPDGRYILHAQIDYRGIDLMMVDNFR